MVWATLWAGAQRSGINTMKAQAGAEQAGGWCLHPAHAAREGAQDSLWWSWAPPASQQRPHHTGQRETVSATSLLQLFCAFNYRLPKP